MPIKKGMSPHDREKRVAKLLREYVADETGVPDPSPAFVHDYLVSLSEPGDSAQPSLGTDTAAAEYPKPDYTLDALAGLDPNSRLAKRIVQEVLGIEDASPNMIRDTMEDSGIPCGRSDGSGATSPEVEGSTGIGSKIYTKDCVHLCQCEIDGTDIKYCKHTEGDVTVLDHQPGINDLVSGVLPPRSSSSSGVSPVVVEPISPQDVVACKNDWESLFKYQPNGLVSLKSIRHTRSFPAVILDQLPYRYHTTVKGLVRAFDEIQRPEGEMIDYDDILDALFSRGGEIANPTFVDADGLTKETIVYAEDLVPYVGEGEERYDADFWEGVEELKRENRKSGLVNLMAWAKGQDENDISISDGLESDSA